MKSTLLQHANGEIFIYTIYFSVLSCSPARWREVREGRALKVIAPLLALRARLRALRPTGRGLLRARFSRGGRRGVVCLVLSPQCPR